jgi:hypothetical protein
MTGKRAGRPEERVSKQIQVRHGSRAIVALAESKHSLTLLLAAFYEASDVDAAVTGLSDDSVDYRLGRRGYIPSCRTW